MGQYFVMSFVELLDCRHFLPKTKRLHAPQMIAGQLGIEKGHNTMPQTQPTV